MERRKDKNSESGGFAVAWAWGYNRRTGDIDSNPGRKNRQHPEGSQEKVLGNFL